MVNPLKWGNTTWSNPDDEMLFDIQKLSHYVAQCQEKQQNTEFDMQIHVGIPNEFEKKAQYSICVTAGIETDRVDPSWVIKSNQGIDKIIVPSKHAKDVFDSTTYEFINQENDTKTQLSCGCPVEVIPYPFKQFDEVPLELELETDFNFLTIAMFGPRKNLGATIKCFVEEFRNNANVGLVIKTGHGRSSIMDRMHTKKVLESMIGNLGEKKCKIYLVHGNMTEAEIHSLYTHPKIKAYFTTTHGEGFGLPVFEAAYSALPVIATNWSGHLDFLSAKVKNKNKKLFAKIDFDLKKIQKGASWKNIIHEESQWAYPKETSIKSQLRKVHKSYNMFRRNAEVLKESILNNFSREKITDQYLISIFGTADITEEKDIEKLREQALAIQNVKERAQFAKNVVSGKNITQNEKIAFLKDLFLGETAYVLSCGPTLTENNLDKLREELSENLCISIKQSYELFQELTDFHIYNCGNFKHYDYSNKAPVVIEASTSPYRLGESDLKFFIQERDYEKSIAKSHDFDSWRFDKQSLLRPYGPGIMYEVVFYTLQHLGVSEAITVGWDNSFVEGSAAQQHFYDKVGSEYDKSDFIDQNEVAENPESVNNLDHERVVSSEAILPWYKWLKENGTTLKIVSDINPAPDEIERITI